MLLVVPLASVTVLAAPVEAGSPEGVSDPVAEAADEAAASGESVEVITMRDEFTRVFAEPEAGVFSQESSAVPVFGWSVEGDLVPIDTSLVRRDGGWGPASSAAPVVFPTGGSGDLRLRSGGHELTVDLPGDLGDPIVEGSAATYEEVFPDVDLVLTATSDGYRQVYVVHTAEAARSAAVRSLTFGLDAGTDRIVPSSVGMSVIDAFGERVFATGAALMWDSSSTMPMARAGGMDLAAGEPGTSEGGPEGPAPGDTWAEMPVTVDDEKLVLKPDQKLLTGPDTVYPVYVDPATKVDRAERLMLRSDGVRNWQFDGNEGMGRCPTSYSSECAGPYVKRLYFEFGRGGLNKGDKVLKAEFSAFGEWSPSCAKREFDVVQTGQISSTTKWAGPAVQRQIATKNMSFGRADCPAKWAEVSNTALRKQAKRLAQGDLSRLTLMLRAVNESDQLAWKRFRQDAKLKVWFVRKPGVPTKLGVRTYPTGAYQCGSTASPTPTDELPASISAIAQTLVQPKERAFGQLDIDFHVEAKPTASGSWVAAGSKRLPGAGYVKDDQRVTGLVAATGGQYQYRVRARTVSSYDETDAGAGSGELTGDWSGWCHFYVDEDAPAAPLVTSTVYPGVQVDEVGEEPATLPASATGGAGVPGGFSVTVNSSDNDANISAFTVRASRSTGESVPVADTSLTRPFETFDFTPDDAGVYWVEVVAVDTLGRTSAASVYALRVPDRSSPGGTWHVTMADGPGVDNAETSGAAGALALTGGVQIAKDGRGRRGDLVDEQGLPLDAALVFQGSDGQATTAGPAADTSGSFTATAWVMLQDTGADQVVFSQVSSGVGFEVGLDAAQNRWFARWRHGSGGPADTVASSALGSAQRGVWVNIGLVYDGTHLKLAVNGRLMAETPLAGLNAQPASRFSVGGRDGSGAVSLPVKGLVDEIRVWESALTPTLLAPRVFMTDLSSGRVPLSLVRNWAVGASTDRMAEFSAFAGTHLAAQGGAVADSSEGTIALDGVDDALVAPAPVVAEDGGFTVAVEMQFDAAFSSIPAGSAIRVLGQRGDGGPGWALWFVQRSPLAGTKRGVWVLGQWGTAPEPTVDELAFEDDDEALESELRIVATSAPLRATDGGMIGNRICVYFAEGGGTTGCELLLEDPRRSLGVFEVGRRGAPDSTTHLPLPATLRRVQVWAGASTEDQIGELTTGEGF